MLTTEEFRAWCQRLQLPPETEALITNIRESPPVRKVRGHVNNVTGRYPSPKMGVSIQFESQLVNAPKSEQPFALNHEHLTPMLSTGEKVV